MTTDVAKGTLCGAEALWQHPRWPTGTYCQHHKEALEVAWPKQWTRLTEPKRHAIHDLEKAIERGCSHPDCDHKNHDELFLKPRCHPKAGVVISYKKGSGVVNVHCRMCKQHVVQIAVALV